MNRLKEKLFAVPWIRRTMQDKFARVFLTSTLSMGWNLLYALFHLGMAFVSASPWYWTMAAYYAALGFMRMRTALLFRSGAESEGRAVLTMDAALMLFLAVVISGITVLSILDFQASDRGNIMAITIATFTFLLVTIAIRNTVLAIRQNNPIMIVLRDISCASAIGSILSLERSMLTTFGDGTSMFSKIMFALSGAAAFVLILWLSFSIFKHRKDMDVRHQ